MSLSAQIGLSLLSWISASRNPLSRGVATICKNYLRLYENCNWNPNTNGELALLDRLWSQEPKVIFDVGANRGDWTASVLERNPHAQVHLFEISSITAELLTKRFQDCEGARVNAVGLGESSGEVLVAYFAAHDDNTRVYSHSVPPNDASIVSETVRTGDSYCKQIGIGKIDLLKIDVEGSEFGVLLGFKDMLEQRAIDVIQFEHVAEFMTRNTRCLEDIYLLLKDYRIGRLFQRGVLSQSYVSPLECIPFSNFVAVGSWREDLWDRIKYK